MNRKVQAFLLMLVATVLVTGCSSKSSRQDTASPDAVQAVGVIDMQQAVQAHPRYSEHEPLQKAITMLEAQLAAMQNGASSTIPPNLSLPAGDNSKAMSGVQAALEQEYNAKMATKRSELNDRLEKKAADIKAGLADEMKTYSDTVDQSYQPQIFNLQLKIKTVQLSQQELDSLRKQMETLQKERDEKISAKDKEMAARLVELIKPEQASCEAELSQYSQKLQTEMAAQTAAKQQELAVRSTSPALTAPAPVKDDSRRADLEQQLTAKQQALQDLENTIVEDVRDKAAKIATAKGLSAVLTGVNTNISAVDITSDVIAEFKK